MGPPPQLSIFRRPWRKLYTVNFSRFLKKINYYAIVSLGSGKSDQQNLQQLCFVTKSEIIWIKEEWWDVSI